MPEVPVTHICLLNEYPTSVLTPIIDPTIPSQKLVIATTEAYSQQSKQVIKLAKTRGYQAEIWELPDTANTLDLKLSFASLFQQEQSTDNQIWLNATNGTRYQALAAFEIARNLDIPIYVVEPNNDALYWVHPDNQAPIPIQDKLKLHEYFSLYNVTLVNQQNKQGIAQHIRLLGASWASQSSNISKALASLNYLAFSAKGDQLASSPMNPSMLNDIDLANLIDDLTDNNMLKLSADKRLYFANSEAKFFCNGGWLEEYVFSLLRGLRSELKTIQDDAHSAEIERLIDGKLVKNELDVIALVNNKLHLIECKTKRMNDGSDTDTLYKLDSLNELLGGVAGKAALVTFQHVSDAAKARAAELNIAVFGPDKLGHLRSHLKTWLSAF